MLYYKAWLESRTRFILALAALVALSVVVVFSHSIAVEHMTTMLRLHPGLHRPWWINRELHEYPFYIWRAIYRGWFRNAWIVCSILAGVGGLTQESVRGSVAFSLSLPVRRRQFTVAHIMVGCAELLILALSPVLIVPALSTFVGGHFSVTEAACRGVLLFAGGVVVFGFTCAAASLVESASVPVIVSIAAVISLASVLSPYESGLSEPLTMSAIDLFRMISGPPDLGWSTFPWLGLLVSLVLSILAAFSTVRVIDARDYR
jgi:ABC-2 type transport system permease protein